MEAEYVEHLWQHSLEKLRDAESKKWDDALPHHVREYNQGIADTLRVILMLMRNDDEFAASHYEEWREFAGGSTLTSEEMLCPIDRRVMNFVFQCMEFRRYKCTHPEDHGVWEFDWQRLKGGGKDA